MVQIKTIRFDDLVQKYSITEIDKILIDIEGYEYEILKDIDLKKIKINSILFEYKHFDGYLKTGNKLEEILRKFEENNYKTAKVDEENMIAVKN